MIPKDTIPSRKTVRLIGVVMFFAARDEEKQGSEIGNYPIVIPSFFHLPDKVADVEQMFFHCGADVLPHRADVLPHRADVLPLWSRCSST